jgi:hypothetical protein
MFLRWEAEVGETEEMGLGSGCNAQQPRVTASPELEATGRLRDREDLSDFARELAGISRDRV